MEGRFDWYQASLPTPVSDVVAALRSMPHVASVQEEVGGFGHGFDARWTARDRDEEPLVTMLSGPRHMPNLRASGEPAEGFASWVRSEFPNHRVSRLDVALDGDEPGLFDRLEARIRRVAADQKMKSGRAIRPDDPAAGATYYLGSAKSNTQIRLYQKGLELMGQGIPASPDLTRLELQWRPAKAGKDLAAKLAPRECWGAARWSQAVYEACVSEHVEAVRVPSTKNALDRVIDHMIGQYSAVLMRFGARELHRVGVVHGSVARTDAAQEAAEMVERRLLEWARDAERSKWDPS